MACALLMAAPVAAAPKLDVVHLRNGDRITCEIRRLDRGVLAVNTDPLGSVSVHWGEVTGVQSPRAFDVELTSGVRYFGSFGAAPPNQMVVATGGGPSPPLALADVVRLAPIGSSLWNRVDGSLDAGFSFAQANLETRITLNSAATYRVPRYQLAASYASQATTRSDADRLFRSDLNLNAARLLGRWYGMAWGALQQNDELSLDLRVVAGGGAGRDMVHTNHRLWSIFGGPSYTHEQFSGEPADQSIEAAVGTQLDFFTPRNNDFRFTNRAVSYVTLGGRSRVRLEAQSTWRHEFLGDFYWSMNGFDSFDGDPPSEQKRNDFGISVNLGWKF